jgi:hypothetical protein
MHGYIHGGDVSRYVLMVDRPGEHHVSSESMLAHEALEIGPRGAIPDRATPSTSLPGSRSARIISSIWIRCASPARVRWWWRILTASSL